MLAPCECGATSKHAVQPQRHLIECPSCHRVYVLGTVVYRVLPGPRATRAPADAALPRWVGDRLRSSRAQASGSGQIGSQLDPRARAQAGEECTVPGGVWRSGEPVTFDMPVELPELWRERATGELYMCALGAMGTRYVILPIASEDAYTHRVMVGARDWKLAAERIG